MNTPEYLAPEVLKHLEQLKQYALLPGPNQLKQMKAYEADMWSIGVMLFEILVGFPVWLSLKGKINTK